MDKLSDRRTSTSHSGTKRLLLPTQRSRRKFWARGRIVASSRSLPFHLKALYGLGEVGEGAKTAALETFLFFYYVQVIGLSGSLTGLALMVALLFDAVTDPMVGSWSDRLRTPLGRRHPFLYAAPVPLAIALFLLFSPPEGSQALLAVWLTVFAIAARFAMTLYFVPHMALGAELSDDFNERIALGGYRTLFGYVGRIATLALAFAIFFANRPGFENGQLDPSSYPGLALAVGALVIVSVLASAVGTQKAALRTRAMRRAATQVGAGALRSLREALRSGSFRSFFIALLIMYLYNGVQFALALHMNSYFWELPPEKIQFVMYAGMAGYLLGVPLTRPASGLFDKKAIYIAGIVGSVLLSSGPTIFRLIGWMPPNGSESLFYILVSAGFGSGMIGALPVVLSSAMLADLADEYDHDHSTRAEGLFFGVNAFCRKAALGLGGAVAGVLIDAIRFPAKAVPGEVAPDLLVRLGVVYAPVMLLILFVGLSFMRGYRLSRERHAMILAKLDGRQAAGSGD
ncbi:MAG: MFS transporter [Hyphomonadaceae bacterium]